MRIRSVLFAVSILFAGGIAAILSSPVCQAKGFAPLRDQFRSPPMENRPLIRWWWFGVAVSNNEIERELIQIRDAGFGGVEIQPVSPMAIFGTHDMLQNLSFLSQEFLNALNFATSKARSLDLTVDIVLGSGWPLGGPHIKSEHGSHMLGGDSSKWPAGEPTNEQSRGSAIGAEGLVLDHYNHAAVAQHLQFVGEKLLAAVDKSALQAVFSDRPEVTGADWTSDFSIEFQRRRGYDVNPVLNSLTSNELDSTDLRHDWAMTLSELLDERFFAQLQEWSKRQQVALRGHPFGTLPATLSSARYFDLPEGEGLPWNGFTAIRWASSAAHLFGKPISSAQIWRHIPPTFRASPLDLKIDADQAFLAGANQVVGHGWPYSPPQAGNPGWVFDTAVVVNPHNPWWPVITELTMYLRRNAFVLRQGDVVNDVAIYLPTHDAWASLSPGNVNLGQALASRVGQDLVPSILRAGYGFDFVDDSALQSLAEINGKRLKLGRQNYSIVILPKVERMPLATLEKLEAFVENGGSLIATHRVPARLPSSRELQENSQLFSAKAAKLFSGDNPPAKVVSDELGVLGGMLRKLVEPDLRTTMVAPQIGYVHRRVGDIDYYFIANTSNLPYENDIVLRVASRQAEWWDAMSGEFSSAQIESSSSATTTVQLSLPAYASKILVFGLPARGRPPRSAIRRAEDAVTPATMDISNGWEVTFEGANIRRYVDWLTAWTESADTRAFSGEAVYRKIVTVTQPKLLAARKLMLSLGEAKPTPPAQQANRKWLSAQLDPPVREAAIVFVNGQRVANVWQPPYDIDLGKLLREGENTIEIRVFNLGINQLAGKPLVDYSWLHEKSASTAPPEGIVPLPAGLFGPVTIKAAD